MLKTHNPMTAASFWPASVASPVCEQFGTAPMSTRQGSGLPFAGLAGTRATAVAYAGKPLSAIAQHVAVRLSATGADGRVPPRGRPV